MSTPTPPDGYRIVHNSEIPIVPEGALVRLRYASDTWDPSTNVGGEPSAVCLYAIPIVKEDAKEVEALKAEIETLKAENEAMRQCIGIQDDEAAVARHELAELRARNSASIACINKQAKVIDMLLQIIKE